MHRTLQLRQECASVVCKGGTGSTSHVGHGFFWDLLALLAMLLPLPLKKQFIWQDEHSRHALEAICCELLQLPLACVGHAAADKHLMCETEVAWNICEAQTQADWMHHAALKRTICKCRQTRRFDTLP